MQPQVESSFWVLGSFAAGMTLLEPALALHPMFPEITPDAIRNATLKRRLRGYDTQETEELFVRVAASYERVSAERTALSEQLVDLRGEQEDHARDSRIELEKLQEQLSIRDVRIAELNAEIARFEEEHSERLEEVERLSKEVSSARATQEAQQAELAEQSASLARLDIREKALVEQIAMFAAQLGQGDAGFAAPTSPRAVSDLDERAAATLHRLDRVVETVARETRRETEMMLKKARERAEEILRSAEVRSRRIVGEIARQGPVDETVRAEFDPVAALERVEEPESEPEAADDPQTADDAEQQLGEALWTSGMRPEEIPERSRSQLR
jgi:cell division septum initiation protein DivIVA